MSDDLDRREPASRRLAPLRFLLLALLVFSSLVALVGRLGDCAALSSKSMYSALRNLGVRSLNSFNLADPKLDGYNWNSDIAQTLALPNLRRLELSTSAPRVTPNRPIAFLPCRLTFLRLDGTQLPAWTTAAILLSVGPTLRKLSLDTGGVQGFPEEEMQMAWAGMGRLQELMLDTWHGDNPLHFDVSFPSILKLRRLCATIWDLEDDFLAPLPPSIHTLQISGFEEDDFAALEALMCATLRDPRWPSRALLVTLVVDEATEPLDLSNLKALGKSKGVDFWWDYWMGRPSKEFV